MKAIKFGVASVLAAVTAILLATGPLATAFSAHAQDSLADARTATARYHDVGMAQANGYGLFPDATGIACIANSGVGAMGVHYVNLALVGAGNIEARSPQAVVYEPMENGQLRLVAVEYIAFQQAWDATHNAPPTLFGQHFMLTPDGNRFGIPAFYSLHVWIWKDNPSGMFSMWNPRVHCDTSTTA